MPLRSVEAATREDAIAAAREQFGPSARVIGVRRVRSGGVLGFFTTERYVAEVEPVSVPRSIGMPIREDGGRDSRGGLDGMDAGDGRDSRDGGVAARAAQLATFLQQQESEQRVEEIAELFSGGHAQAEDVATYSRASFQRPATQAAAAGTFAQSLAAQSLPEPSPSARSPFAQSVAARSPFAQSVAAQSPFAQSVAAQSSPGPSPFAQSLAAVRPPSAPFPSAPVSFSGPPEEPPAPSSDYPREGLASALRKAAEARGRGAPTPILRQEPPVPSEPSEPAKAAEPAEPSPSPFTAALARMVAGDREVRQAVQDALDSQLAGDAGTSERPWTAATPRVEPNDTRTGAEHQSMGAQHQEEKPVSQLETTMGPSSTGQALPNWADEPTAETSSREDAIAQILRTALAQNHSDDALADILRKVLADTSTSPAAATAPAPVAAPAPWDEPIVEPLWAPAPSATAWPGETAQPTTPVAFAEPVRTYAQAADDDVVVVPIDLGIPAPAPAPMPTAPFPVSMAPVATVETAAVSAAQALPAVEEPLPLAEIAADEPIWAEVVLHEPAPTQEAPAVQPLVQPLVQALVQPLVQPLVQATVPPVPLPTVQVAASAAPPVLQPMTPAAAALAQAIRAQIMGVVPAADQAAMPPAAMPPATATTEAPVEQVSAQAEPARVASSEAPIAAACDHFVAHELAADPVAGTLGEIPAEAPAEPLVVEEPAAAEASSFAVSELARTASDPAPLPADATTVMPALSLLPPLPGARRGSRPPVPPPSRPAAPPSTPEAEDEHAEAPQALATVTMLPVISLVQPAEAANDEAAIDERAIDERANDEAANDERAIDEVDEVTFDQVEAQNLDAFACIAEIDEAQDIEEPAPTVEEYVAAMEAFLEPAVAVPAEQPRAALPAAALDRQSGDVVSRLRALGIPGHVLGAEFAADAQVRGTYAALTTAMSRRLPGAPVLPTGAGDVVFVVGPGVATLRAARSMAASVGLHPDCVQWASRGELAGLAPKNFRMSTIDDALDRRQEVAGCGTVTIVAVDAPLRTDAYWIGQMLAVWTPVAVWAVAEATRKPEDLGEWLDELPRVDALVLQDTDLSADPAAVLERVSMPVALLDGIRATPHRWASLLCERLESDRA